MFLFDRAGQQTRYSAVSGGIGKAWTGTARAHLAQGGSAIIATHIDLGLSADVLDVAPFKAIPAAIDDFDGAFDYNP